MHVPTSDQFMVYTAPLKLNSWYIRYLWHSADQIHGMYVQIKFMVHTVPLIKFMVCMYVQIKFMVHMVPLELCRSDQIHGTYGTSSIVCTVPLQIKFMVHTVPLALAQ